MAVEEMMRGVQLGAGIASDRLNRNLREQELRSIEASRKLEERKVAQDLAFQLQQQNMATQYRADAEKAMRQTMIETSPVLPAPGSPMGVIPNPNQQPMERALLKNLGPVIGKYEPNKLGSFVQDIAMMPFKRQAYEALQSDPEIRTEIDPTTGKQISFSKTPRGWQRIPDDVATRQKLQFENQSKLATFKKALEARPDIAEFDERGVPTISPEKYAEAAKLAGLESGTKSQLEQQQISGEKVFRTGRKLMGLLEGNVGVPGAIKRGLAQVGLDKAFGVENASDAIAAQTVGREFVAGIFRALRSDSNINKDEVSRLESAAPDPTRLITTPKVEKAKLLAILESAFETSRSNAQRMGTPITPMFLTVPEIEARIANGQLTAEQAKELWDDSATAMMEELRSQIK